MNATIPMPPAWPTPPPRSMGGGTHSGLHEPVADRPAGELDAVAHAELGEDVLAVAVDGPWADVEDPADLLAGVRLGDQLRHLLLAVRQRARVPARVVE